MTYIYLDYIRITIYIWLILLPFIWKQLSNTFDQIGNQLSSLLRILLLFRYSHTLHIVGVHTHISSGQNSWGWKYVPVANNYHQENLCSFALILSFYWITSWDIINYLINSYFSHILLLISLIMLHSEQLLLFVIYVEC